MAEKLGRLESHYGPMSSGKTAALIEAMDRAKISKKPWQAFKLFKASREEGPYKIRTKKQIDSEPPIWIEIPATPVNQASEIVGLLKKDICVVGIDEGQLFDNGILPVISELVRGRGMLVVVSGLATDYQGELFGPMPKIIFDSDKTTPHVAVCEYKTSDKAICGEEANRTQRLFMGEPVPWGGPVVLIGDTGDGEKNKEYHYEARCPRHHIVPGRPY